MLSVSALAKARVPRSALVDALRAFGTPAPLARLLWWVLPLLEVGLAAALLLWWDDAGPAWATLAVLSVFTGALATNLLAGRRPACPCFGVSDRPISGLTVLRNGALMALAVLATG